MILTATIDYLCALRLDHIRKNKLKDNPKKYVVLTLILNLGFLAFFKYSYFMYDNFVNFMSIFGMNGFAQKLPYHIILPLGISFYTFHSISYTIDIYRNTYPAERNYFYFIGFVTFWPQLVAGPILRADEILGQFYIKHQFKLSNLYEGIKRIIQGLFLKVVLADNIGKFSDEIYSLNPHSLSAGDVVVAAILFGYQIYFDFAGYSSIAVGSGRILGFNIPENFNWPYMSGNPKSFWKNWHISLSSWIRDYLYIPLTGQKFKVSHGTVGGLGEVFDKDENTETAPSGLKITSALFLTWIIMGLWHGAGWNFAFWGVYHAFFITVFRFLKWEKKNAISWFITFLIAMLGWIPFRAQGIEQAFIMYSRLFSIEALNPLSHKVSFVTYGWSILILVGMLISYYLFVHKRIEQKNVLVEISVNVIMLVFVLFYLQTNTQFIYFQF